MFRNYTVYCLSRSNIIAYATFFLVNYTLFVTTCDSDETGVSQDSVFRLGNGTPKEAVAVLKRQFNTSYVYDATGDKWV